MKLTIMHKASVGSLRITEVLVIKIVDDFVYMKGGRDRRHGGYVRYFPCHELEQAKEWIVSQRSRWSDKVKITKEQIDEYQIEDLSDKDRAAGKFSVEKAGFAIRGLSNRTRRECA